MRLEELRRRMAAEGVDGVLVSDELSESYLCGFEFTDGYLAILPDKAYIVTDFRYTEAATRQAGIGFEVLQSVGSQLSFAIDVLVRGGASKVAFEEESVTVSLKERMERVADGKLSFVGKASGWLASMREIKDARELERMAKAQAITDAAFAHILDWITPNMTEREVALELEYFMRRMGAGGMAFDVIAVSGSESSLPHGVPRPCKLERGFFTMDFGAKVEGYCSDMTRTVVLGKADAEMRRLYDTVLAAQTEALAFLKEGCSCLEADGVARSIIEGAGYKGCFGHSLGHSVGRFIHESPRLSPASKPTDRLVAGNTVTVEPGIYMAGKYGCRIEDMVAVTDNGIFNFTKSRKDMIELF